MHKASRRPELSLELIRAEFGRWYWTMADLQTFARARGLRTAGPKVALTERVAAHLGGEVCAEEVRQPPGRNRLGGVLDDSTVIADRQRATQELRAFFVSRIGPSFRFDGHMRAFLEESAGATLGDAIAHWHGTRGHALPPQSRSLEFNRFIQQWHRIRPDGSSSEARAAWLRYRSLPVDERPPIGLI